MTIGIHVMTKLHHVSMKEKLRHEESNLTTGKNPDTIVEKMAVLWKY